MKESAKEKLGDQAAVGGAQDHIRAYISRGEFTHHAHAIEAVHEQAAEIVAVIRALEHAAVDVLQEESLLIDHVRELQRKQQLHATGGYRKVFVVHVGSMQHEAQHALLKLIEEPTDKTHFFFILPSLSLVLPTVASRLFFLGRYGVQHHSAELVQLARDFVAAPIPERLKMVAFLYEEDAPRGGKQATQEFVQVVLVMMRARALTLAAKAPSSNSEVAASNLIYERCAAMADFAGDKASSSKMIVEYLAFLIP
jgi:hypothetical protein